MSKLQIYVIQSIVQTQAADAILDARCAIAEAVLSVVVLWIRVAY